MPAAYSVTTGLDPKEVALPSDLNVAFRQRAAERQPDADPHPTKGSDVLPKGKADKPEPPLPLPRLGDDPALRAEQGRLDALLAKLAADKARLSALDSPPTIIRRSDGKAAGNPYEPLSDATRANFQGQIDDIYAAFVRAVASNRGTTAAKVQAQYGAGMTVLAPDAKRAGMVDRVAPLDEVLDEAVKSAGRGRTVSALAAGRTSLEVLRLRQLQRRRQSERLYFGN